MSASGRKRTLKTRRFSAPPLNYKSSLLVSSAMLTGNSLETKEAGRFLSHLLDANPAEPTHSPFFLLQWLMNDKLTGKQQ